MGYNKLKFPKYDGNETQNEHVVYNYLSTILKEKGYLIKIKKTNFSNIDDNIISTKGISTGACDAYIFSENSANGLYCLVELESNGNLTFKGKGIDQVRNYAKSLMDAFKCDSYKTKHVRPYLIAYDGNKLWVAQFDLNTGKDVLVIGHKTKDSEDGIEVTDESRDKFLDIFVEKPKIEIAEKSLIRKTKQILRADKNLQGHKAFILTVLASIYGNTTKDGFDEAIIMLRNLKNSGNKDSEVILGKWETIAEKIGFFNDDNFEVQLKIKKLYSEVAKKLFIISQDKQVDLYGYIYEELAEKSIKKEDGEYYTPRKHIRAILNSVFSKYLFNKWDLNKDKYYSFGKILNRRITDPFCGSGGFLYVFLKLIKEKYEFDSSELSEISKMSIWGLDKNDTTAAYFNLFLIGDGEATLKSVVTTINWQNAWKYKVLSKGDKNNVRVIKIEDEKELNVSINQFRATFLLLLDNMIDMHYVKNVFSLKNPYKRTNNIAEFIAKFQAIQKKVNPKYFVFSELITDEYRNDKKPVLKLIYDIFKMCSNNPNNVETYDIFINSLGRVDFLPTNVPYGSLDDIRFKGEIGNRLESQAVIECIDLLRPSSSKFDDDNGALISNNDGGVATIIIPSGLFEREDVKFREYLLKKCKILSIIKLPLYTFSPYASIQTYVLTFRKKAVFEFSSLDQEQDIFMYIIDNDGKANSDKRYPTNLIHENRTDIFSKSGDYISSVFEYIHNEIEVNLERYPEGEGYLSQLERAWIYGKTSSTVSYDWNQIRYTQNWNGKSWDKLYGKKWAFKKLKRKTYEKQIEKKKLNIISIINKLINYDEEFVNCSIEEQKELIIRELKINYLNSIYSIEKNNETLIIKNYQDTRMSIFKLKKELFSNYFRPNSFSGLTFFQITTGLPMKIFTL